MFIQDIIHTGLNREHTPQKTLLQLLLLLSVLSVLSLFHKTALWLWLL